MARGYDVANVEFSDNALFPPGLSPQARAQLTEELTEAQAESMAFKEAFEEKATEARDKSELNELLQNQVCIRQCFSLFMLNMCDCCVTHLDQLLLDGC